MLVREDFDMWLNMLIEARGWRNMGDESRDIFLDQLNKYEPTLEDFGDYCAKILDADYCQPNDIIKFFKAQHHEQLKQKALPQSDIKADLECEGFVRFARMGRELRAALAQKKGYPCAKWPSTAPSMEFKEQWQRPLTEKDYEYAASRRQQIKRDGFAVSLGGGLGLP